MIDPSLFDVPTLLADLLRSDAAGHLWRAEAEIVPNYLPPHPRPGDRPECIVRFGNWFLRHSQGPRQGHSWDVYGDDYLRPGIALLALMEAPPPPPVWSGAWSKSKRGMQEDDR